MSFLRSDGPSVRGALWVVVLLVLGTVVPLGSGLAAGTPAHVGAAASGGPNVVSAAPPKSAPPAAHPVPGSGAPSSGPGTFFDNTNLSNAPTNHAACVYYGSCMNDTGNPSITSTSAGVIATAYTSLSNYTSCTGQGNKIYSEIGINVSTNGGASWGRTTYLDNPACASQPETELTSAMMPSIAALPNGTLVLAYIEYSADAVNFCTDASYAWWPSLAPCYVTNDSLVVTYSFNNGVNWTLPTVINSTSNGLLNQTSWMASDPQLAVYGTTIYLAWSNWTYPDIGFFSRAPSMGLNLIVSNDSGVSWGVPVELPVQTGTWQTLTTWVDYSPHLLVNATGTLFISYSTGYTEYAAQYCDAFGCSFLGFPGIDATLNVVVAQTSDNGSSWLVSTVASGVPVTWNGLSWIVGAPGALFQPAPSIAIDPSSGQLFIAYSAGLVGKVCFTYGCFTEEGFEGLFVSNSTNGGTTWSTPVALGTPLLGMDGSAKGDEFLGTPSIGVAGNGTVFVDAAFVNNSVCVGTNCDLWTDLVFESTDHAATFDNGFVPFAGGTIYGYPLWDGFNTAITIQNGTPFIAWTLQICPTSGTAYCSQPGPIPWSTVMISSPFTGVGVNVSFVESGLPLGYNWTADLSGNLRSGPAGTPLNISGAPTGQVEVWTVPWVGTTTYGIQYGSNTSIPSPGKFVGATTITVTFIEEVLLQVTTVPPGYPGWAFSCNPAAFFADYCANQVLSPGVGTNWVPNGTTFPYSVTQVAFPSNCYNCMNLSFISWSSSSASGWSSTLPNGTARVNGPTNETASFNINNVCSYGVCTNLTYNYAFAEVGLPSGTPWTVSLGNQTATSSGPSIGFNGGQGPLNFTVWTVPFNATEVYVGTPSTPSPVGALQGGQELVNFTLQPIARLLNSVTAGASGLPAGVTDWGFELNGVTYAVPAATATFTLLSGNITLNASNVYGPNGIGGHVTGFTVTPEVVGATSTHVGPGGTYFLSGPTQVTADYAPEYALNVTHTAGGSVTGPTNVWVDQGVGVNLTAAASAGFMFVGWSGTGGGSVTALTPTITVHPSGPVEELATFVAVVPTFQVQVSASGVPGAIPVTVSIGSQTITAAPPFTIAGFVSGTYAVTVPTVYPNGTEGARYVTTSVSSSLPLSGGLLHVTANGTLQVTYAVQYALTVTAATNGTSNPAPGTYWEAGGVAVPLTAVPNTGFLFLGWIGVGTSSVTDTNLSISVSPTGPVTETPDFALYVPPPGATYSITVSESGLPNGVSWSATVAGGGASGSGILVISGLNGSFELTVPIVTGGPGIRYVPSTGTVPEDANMNLTASVVFTTQYYVSVSASTGGAVTPGSTWVNQSGSLAIGATASSGYTFVGWTGTGSGSYSGATASSTVTASAPITEVATFAPVSSPTTSSGSSGLGTYALPIGLLVALLVIGLVVGLVLGRSGGRRPPSAETTEATSETESAPAETDPSGSGTWPEGPSDANPAPPSGGTEEDTVYGGGAG